MALKFPTIPEPTPDNTYEVVRALKDTVELITGQRGSDAAVFVRVFNEDIEPGVSNSKYTHADIKRGDFWVKKSTGKIYVWDDRTKFWVAST